MIIHHKRVNWNIQKNRYLEHFKAWLCFPLTLKQRLVNLGKAMPFKHEHLPKESHIIDGLFQPVKSDSTNRFSNCSHYH